MAKKGGENHASVIIPESEHEYYSRFSEEEVLLRKIRSWKILSSTSMPQTCFKYSNCGPCLARGERIFALRLIRTSDISITGLLSFSSFSTVCLFVC